jgi:hypothetical protein
LTHFQRRAEKVGHIRSRNDLAVFKNADFYDRRLAARLQMVGNIWWLVGKLLFFG